MLCQTLLGVSDWGHLFVMSSTRGWPVHVKSSTLAEAASWRVGSDCAAAFRASGGDCRHAFCEEPTYTKPSRISWGINPWFSINHFILSFKPVSTACGLQYLPTLQSIGLRRERICNLPLRNDIHSMKVLPEPALGDHQAQWKDGWEIEQGSVRKNALSIQQTPV